MKKPWIKKALITSALIVMLALLPCLALAEDALSWRAWEAEKTLALNEEAFTRRLQTAIDAALAAEPLQTYQTTYSAVDVALGGKHYQIDVDVSGTPQWTHMLVSDGKAYRFDDDLGAMIAKLATLTLGKDTALSLRVPGDVQAVFSRSGFTPLYHINDIQIQLPKKLECKHSSGVGTYFAFVRLLLEGGGWDLTQYANKEITAELYGVLERHNRSLFLAEDREREAQGMEPVQCAVRAVVLRSGSEIIGAYITSEQYPSWMFSVNGRTSYDLLGDQSVEGYLRSRYTMTSADKENARLSPEQVIRAWAKARDRQTANLYEPLSHWLDACMLNVADDQLYTTVADQPYAPISAKGLSMLKRAPEYDQAGWRYYDAGLTYVSVSDLGKGIGWKVGGSGGF